MSTEYHFKLYCATYTKVGQLELSIFGLRLEENVLGFQVWLMSAAYSNVISAPHTAVNNALVVEVLDGRRDGTDDVGCIPALSVMYL